MTRAIVVVGDAFDGDLECYPPAARAWRRASGRPAASTPPALDGAWGWPL